MTIRSAGPGLKIALLSLTLGLGSLAGTPSTDSLLPYLLHTYGGSLPAVAARKQAYAQAHGLTIWADYSRAADPVEVRHAAPTVQTRARKLHAAYDPASGYIVIYERDTALLRRHELSHALQRDAVLAHLRTRPRDFTARLVLDGLNGRPLDSRMRSLLMQSELEVRLMQLNRAFFETYGRAIFDRQDALLALRSVGLTIDRATLRHLGLAKPRRRDVRKIAREHADVHELARMLALGHDGLDWYLPSLRAILLLTPALY